MNNEKQWMEVENDLRDYIHNRLFSKYKDLQDFNDNMELVDSKILSSLSLVDLLSGIEDHLNYEIINDDVGIEDFSTVNKIMKTVKKNYLKEV
jgi:acyl carrier protein